MTGDHDDLTESLAVREAYLRHAPELRRFIYGLTKNREQVDEFSQATFAKLVENFGDIDPARLKAWLFRVAFNEVMLSRRKTGVRTRLRPTVARSVNDSSMAPLESLNRSEDVKRVRQAIEELPAEQQAVVKLRIYEELKFAEIAERLAVPLGTVLGRMRTATLKLARILDNESESR